MNEVKRLDYTIETTQERLDIVNDIIANSDTLSPAYLEKMGDYLVATATKEERRAHKLMTDNRRATINKRETSLEGLIAKFENGEDGIYGLVDEGNKNALFRPRISITKQDLEEIPELADKRASIDFWKEKLATLKARGVSNRDVFIIKSTIIELSKDQYLIKDAYRKPIKFTNITHSTKQIALPHEEWVDEEDRVRWSGLSFCDANVVSLTLTLVNSLKAKSRGHFQDDTWYYVLDFERLVASALEPYPMYARIVELKQAFYSNAEIQTILQTEFGVLHSIEYISSLWRNKIPKVIAEKEQENVLVWWHTYKVKSRWKRCSRCGQIKLMHNHFFSINKTSKDFYYSLCKQCRNKKKKVKEE